MKPWYVLASGPSLTPEDLERVRWEHQAGRGKVIAVNSTAFCAPWADYCFAMDGSWLKRYRGKCGRYPWEVISSKVGCETYGARHVGPLKGENSGEKAITYAAKHGEPVVVLGWDCGPVDGMDHHFGEHPPELSKLNAGNWPEYALDLEASLKGKRIINCSPHSDAFENMTLEAYLGY